MASARHALLQVSRAALVVAGLVVAVSALRALATMPGPPGGDGLPGGLALVFGGLLAVAGLALAGAGVALPAAVGGDDPLGFGRGQRRLLAGGASLVVGAVGLGVLAVLAGGGNLGVLVWLLLTLLGVIAVGLALAWRLLDAVRRAVGT